MKLVRYSVGDDAPAVGAIEGGEIRPLAHESMLDFIEYGGSPEPGEDTVPLPEVRLHAPLSNPQKIVCIGLN